MADTESISSSSRVSSGRSRDQACTDQTYMVLHERYNVFTGERLIGSKPMMAMKDWRRYSDLIGLAKTLGGSIPVRYFIKADQHGIGRFRCEVMSGDACRTLPTYMSMLREVRAHLATPLYWEVGFADLGSEAANLDMVNSAPTIMLQTLRKYGIPCPLLDRYVAARDASIAEVQDACGVSRDTAKTLFLRFMFLGSIPGWAKEVAKDEQHAKDLMAALPEWVMELSQQLLNSSTRLLEHADFSQYQKRQASGTDTASSMRSAMALAMQTRERQCLEALVEGVQQSGRTIGALIHDGMHIERAEGEEAIEEAQLHEWRLHVLRRTGYDLQLKVKLFECNPAWLCDADNNDTDDRWMDNCDTTMLSYEEMKALWEKRSFKLLDLSAFVRVGAQKRVVYSRQKLIDSFEHLSYAVVNTDSDCRVHVKRHPFLLSKRDGMPCWLKDPHIRRFDSMDMVPPPAVCLPDVYNTWNSFAADLYMGGAECNAHPTRMVHTDSEGVQAYIKHMDILFGGHQPTVKYVLDWLAQLVQRPGVKPGVALVLKGEEGVGKNRLTDLVKLMVGDDKCLETCKPSNSLYGRFTSQREGKLFVVINEASGAENLSNSDAIKDMITGATFVCEGKHINAYTARCFARFVFCTNNDHILQLSPKDRRFVVMEVQSTLLGNTSYFKELSKHIDNEHTRYEFYSMLKERDISDVDWINDRPLSRYQRAMVEMSLPLEHVFLRDCIVLRTERGVIVKRATRLFEDFMAWLEMGRHKYQTNERRFGVAMSALAEGNARLDGVVKGRRKEGVVYEFNIPMVRMAMVQAKWMTGDEVAAITQYNFLPDEEEATDGPRYDPLGG